MRPSETSMNHLPEINALLNSLSAILVVLGYFFIRRKRISAHKVCMLSAFSLSALFLVCYVTYHFTEGIKYFTGTGAIRAVYFTILTSHTILAVVIVPLVLITLARALKGRFDRHRAIARWTLPLWLYVSVTGVVVYFMLFRLYTPR